MVNYHCIKNAIFSLVSLFVEALRIRNTRSFILSIFLCMIITVVPFEVCRAADWPVWGGPGGNFITSEKVNLDKISNPKKLWQFNIGRGYSSIALEDGLVYAMGNADDKDTIFCLNARTGQVIWKYSYPHGRGGSYSGPQSMPVIDGNYLYTVSKYGMVFCLDKSKGTVVWKVELQKAFYIDLPGHYLSCSPVIEGNILFLNVSSRGVALDKLTGKKVWASSPGFSGYASPVIFTYKGKRAAALFGADRLFVVDIKTGDLFFSYPWKTRYEVNAADPVIFDNKIFLTSGYGKGCILLDISGDKPEVLWQNTNVASHFSTPVYYKGYLYCTNDDALKSKGDVRCIDPATGKVLWRSPELGVNSLIIADGNIIILNERGDIFVSAASSGGYSLLASTQKAGKAYFWTAPVIAEGMLLIRNNRGDVFCFDVK